LQLKNLLNFKGDLFATAFCFAAQAVVRMLTSVILTRILAPEAYGTITILVSIAFVVEMLGDIGATTFIVRDPEAEQPRLLNTAWSLRLARAALNTSVLMIFAPLLANLYQTPSLIVPLRVFSVTFLIGGFETMAFPLAIRRKRASISMYSELAVALATAVFTVVYCHFSRNFWGIVYGMLFSRVLLTALSYQFFKELRPRWQIDRPAVKQMFSMSRFTMPSGIMTMALSQFDKIVFLRLFDLRLLGIYGLATNIGQSIESLVLKISNSVLYARCAHNFRADPKTLAAKYYSENVKLFASILFLPAAIGGAANLIVSVLYPKTFDGVAVVLQAFMLRVVLLALATPAEDLLVATGEYHVILIGGLLRVAWMLPMSLLGYFLFGFTGFVYGIALSPLLAMAYFFTLQHRRGLMTLRYEVYKAGFIAVVWASAWLAGSLLLPVWSAVAPAHRR